MDVKTKYLEVKEFLDSIQSKVIFGEAMTYREIYILNDLCNQLHDSISVLDIEAKYK